MDFKPSRPRKPISSIDGFVPRTHRPGSHAHRPIGIPDRRPKREESLNTPRPVAKQISPFEEANKNLGELPADEKKVKRTRFLHRRKKERSKTFKRVRRGLITVAVVVLFIGGWLGIKILGNLDKVLHGNVITDAHALLTTTKLKGEDQGRVNILLAGDSADDPGHDGANLTDSIMVVSIDTKNHTGFMLSVPRDLWVDIPSMGHEKINAANTATTFSQSGFPSGGMGQLEQIVQTDLGIPIDYYSLIDYSALRDAVNAVGGISINIKSSDPRGLYDPDIDWTTRGPLVKLTNGQHTLNGEQALDLARARGDAYGAYGFAQSDFTRTQNQRQMLVALEQKASSAGVLSNPIRVGQLFDSIGSNVHTDLNLADVLRFTQLTKGMSPNNLQSLTYSESGTNALITDYTAADGEEALIPKAGLDDFSAIQHYYQQLTSSNPVVQEDATVTVLNASSVTGLAKQQATALENKGFEVSATTNASTDYPSSLIIDASGGKDPNSLKALQQQYPSTTVTTSTATPAEATEAQGYSSDFVVILGNNWASSSSSSSSQSTTGSSQ